MPVVEFVWWPGTEEFLANLDELFKPTIDHVSKADGCLRIYSGIQDEDKSVFWMVVVWKSHEHHQAMMDRPDYPEMVERLKPYLRGELKMSHVEFNRDTDAAFNAPITEVLFLSLKAGCTNNAMETALETWAGIGSRGDRGDRGDFQPITWGPTHENPSKSIVLIGWNEKQYRDDLSTGDSKPGYLGPMNDLSYPLADIEIVSLRLRRSVES